MDFKIDTCSTTIGLVSNDQHREALEFDADCKGLTSPETDLVPAFSLQGLDLEPSTCNSGEERAAVKVG